MAMGRVVLLGSAYRAPDAMGWVMGLGSAYKAPNAMGWAVGLGSAYRDPDAMGCAVVGPKCNGGIGECLQSQKAQWVVWWDWGVPTEPQMQWVVWWDWGVPTEPQMQQKRLCCAVQMLE